MIPGRVKVGLICCFSFRHPSVYLKESVAVVPETRILHGEREIGPTSIIRTKIDTHSHLITFLVPNSDIGIVLFKNNSCGMLSSVLEKLRRDVRLFFWYSGGRRISGGDGNLGYWVGGDKKHQKNGEEFEAPFLEPIKYFALTKFV